MSSVPPSKIVLTFAVVLFAIDMIWIKGMSKLHRKIIQDVSKEPPSFRYGAGMLFYLIAAQSWYHFVYQTPRSDKHDKYKDGALLGLAMYSTFDLTMIAAYKNYPIWYGVCDIAWGTLAMAAATSITLRLLSV